MKIEIAPEKKQNLIANRAAIADTVTEFNAATASLAKMQSDRPALVKRVADLIATTDHADEAAVNRLVTARGQLQLLDEKIPLAMGAIELLPVQLFARLGEASPAIADAVRPALEQLRAEITNSLRPHFGPGKGLEQVVEESPTVIDFKNFFHRTFAGGPPNAVKNAPAALEMLDELISGKTTWSFKAA